jgi:hypothetical protein
MKNWKKLLPGLGIAATALVARLLVGGAENDILINSGAKTYRALLWAARIGLLAGLGLLAIGVVSAVLKQRQAQAAAAAQQKVSRKPAPLSAADGRFNEPEIRSHLLSLFSSSPAKAVPYLEAFQAQLDRMNGYQARLTQLLDQNGAQDLREAESFLDRVEQNMFGTMRRVYNLLMMYDEAQPIQPLLDQLAEAQAHNDRALDQASRLCAAMTEYVNSQGASSDAYGSVEQFIQILQEELV